MTKRTFTAKTCYASEYERFIESPAFCARETLEFWRLESHHLEIERDKAHGTRSSPKRPKRRVWLSLVK